MSKKVSKRVSKEGKGKKEKERRKEGGKEGRKRKEGRKENKMERGEGQSEERKTWEIEERNKREKTKTNRDKVKESRNRWIVGGSEGKKGGIYYLTSNITLITFHMIAFPFGIKKGMEVIDPALTTISTEPDSLENALYACTR